MDSDYGVPRELSDLQKLRSQYQPQLPPCLQVLVFLFSIMLSIYYFIFLVKHVPDFRQVSNLRHPVITWSVFICLSFSNV